MLRILRNFDKSDIVGVVTLVVLLFTTVWIICATNGGKAQMEAILVQVHRIVDQKTATVERHEVENKHDIKDIREKLNLPATQPTTQK